MMCCRYTRAYMESALDHPAPSATGAVGLAGDDRGGGSFTIPPIADRAAGLPLWLQVKQSLSRTIEGMKSGESIPPEPELVEHFSVSRITVRKAIDELVMEGRLQRQQGRGTFVTRPKLTHKLNTLTSWTESVSALGYRAATTQISLTESEPPRKVVQLLGLPPGGAAVRLYRIRSAEGEPLCIMVNYLNSRFVPGLARQGLTGESLYAMLERRYRLTLERAEDTVEARECTEEEANVLGLTAGTPVIQVTRVTYLPDDVPLEVVFATSRADRYQYRVSLSGRPRGATAPRL